MTADNGTLHANISVDMTRRLAVTMLTVYGGVVATGSARFLSLPEANLVMATPTGLA